MNLFLRHPMALYDVRPVFIKDMPCLHSRNLSIIKPMFFERAYILFII